MMQAQEIKLESLADGPGLLPYKLGATRLITQYHTYLQYIQLNDFEDNINLLQHQLQTYQSRLPNDTYDLYELQINYLSKKTNKAWIQLKSLEPDYRVKRGLVNGLGSIVKSITGNLDHEDALRYNNVLKDLQVNQDKIISEFNNHISLNKEWMLQYTNVISQLAENQSKINATIDLLIDSNAHAESSLLKYAKFAQLLEIIGENMEDLILELDRIENMLAFIRTETTHHSMVKIDVLKDMIGKLKHLYDKDQILDLEIREYYNIIKPGFYYVGKQIVIIFSIPIVSRDTYELYRLSIVPNKNRQALIPPYPFLATNELSFVYMEAECPKLKNWYLCEKKFSHQVRSTPDCIQTLIRTQALDKTCSFTPITLSKEALDKLDDHHYVISFPNETRIHSTCGSEVIDILQGSYLVTIPVKCLLRTAQFTITNDRDVIKGQPLKLMKIPYASEQQITSHPLRLNSIDLQGLHSIQNKVMMEAPVDFEKENSTSMYHTTIPFYIVMLITAVIIIAFIIYRKRRWIRNLPAASDINKEIYEDPEKIRNMKREKDVKDIPATFSLKVLK